MDLVKLDALDGSGDAWIMQGVLTGLTLLVGPSQSKKSFLAVDMAVHIAGGKTWHGHQVTKGAVVYIVGEGGAVNVARRAREAARHAELPPEAIPLYFLPHALPLSEPASLGGLQAAIEALPERPTLVIVDTLSQCMPGDENKQEDMQRFVASCNELRPAGECVLVLHHTPISAKKPRPRGSSVLIGAADASFIVTADRRTHPAIVRLKCDKLKDQDTEGFEPSVLVPHQVRCRDHEGELILDNWGDVVDTLILDAPDPGDTRNRAAVAYSRLCGLEATRERHEAVGWAEWMEASADVMSKATFKRAVAGILESPDYPVWRVARGHYSTHPDEVTALGVNFETDHDEAMRREAEELDDGV